MHSADQLVEPKNLEILRALEESLWRAETRFDNRLMNSLFAPDFFEFGRSGRTYSRAGMLFDPADMGTIEATLPLANFHARHLSASIVQVTYISEIKRDGEIERGNRSSIWSKTSNGWVLRFHQGTPTV